ncbi:MAG TPA: protein kinase [Blastocatellia bacterium]|nr:protein kinase [Blastocatellia bacterium]
MKPERWQQLDQLLEAALERPPAERAAFLAEACAGDETLRQEVESLLRSDEAAESFIETPATALAGEVLAAQQARSLVGQQLGHYQILSQLGAGGMGEVWLAQDTRLHRRVALKLLPARLTADKDAGRRFLREARAAAALEHPNICAVYEVGEEGERSFIVMQYVEGESLCDKLRRERLSVEASVALASQIADALAEAHAHQIIHRDIKPANIIVTPRGQAKVLDFGLAKFMQGEQPADGEATTASLLSTPGLVMGTVPYMSPEQVRGEELDARTDIFSFGTVLYEMISGRRPFEAKSTAEIVSAILTREPPPLRDQEGAVPVGLERLVRKCLEKEQSRRYQTMEELAIDLGRVRREGKSDQVESFTGDAATASVEAAVSQHRAEWRRLLSSRSALAMIVLVILGAATAYTLFFRRPALTPAPGIKSINSAAYDDYMRGKVIVGSENREDNETAIKLLEQAVRADPGFAAAWAGLARAYNKKAFYLAPGAEKKQLNVDAEVAVEKALTLDPDLAEGHYTRGLILWTPARRFPHEQAIQSYKRAIALNPKLDDAHHELGVVYFHIGLLDKGWAEIEKALEINPGNTLARFRLGVINIYRGRYEEALAVFKSTPRDTNPALFDRNLATALFQLGRMDEASAVVEEYLKTYPKDEGGNVTSVKAMLLARAGKAREAEETIQHAIEIGKSFGHFHHTAYNIASAYAILHRPAEAVKWLEVAADDGFPCYPWFEYDANLNNLRKDERFIAFMTKLRKQWEHYQATL